MLQPNGAGGTFSDARGKAVVIVGLVGSILFGVPDMILSVKLKPEAGDKLKLGFEEVDVLLLIAHQFLEQIPGHVILGAMAITRRFLIKGTRGHLSRKIAIQYLFDGLPDMQRIEHL